MRVRTCLHANRERYCAINLDINAMFMSFHNIGVTSDLMKIRGCISVQFTITAFRLFANFHREKGGKMGMKRRVNFISCSMITFNRWKWFWFRIVYGRKIRFVPMFRVQMEFKTRMHYELVYLSKWITKFIASCFYLEKRNM